jgi:hypothetical protein
VPEIKKPEYTPCAHLCSKGCGIQGRKPVECATWKCGWLAVRAIPAMFRPDRCGVLLAADTATVWHPIYTDTWAREVWPGAFDTPKGKAALKLATRLQWEVPVAAVRAVRYGGKIDGEKSVAVDADLRKFGDLWNAGDEHRIVVFLSSLPKWKALGLMHLSMKMNKRLGFLETIPPEEREAANEAIDKFLNLDLVAEMRKGP